MNAINDIRKRSISNNQRRMVFDSLKSCVARLLAGYQDKPWDNILSREAVIILDELNGKYAQIKDKFAGKCDNVLYKNQDGAWRISPPAMLDNIYKILVVDGQYSLGCVRDVASHKVPDGKYAFHLGHNGALKIYSSSNKSSSGEILFDHGKIVNWSYTDIKSYRMLAAILPGNKFNYHDSAKWLDKPKLARSIKCVPGDNHHRRKSSGHRRSGAMEFDAKFLAVFRNNDSSKKFDIDGIPVFDAKALPGCAGWKRMRDLQMSGSRMMRSISLRA